MSEIGGLCKHEHNQHALAVPQKAKCGCPSGGGVKHVTFATSYGGRQTKRKEKRNVAAHVAEELNTSHSLPLLWRNAEKKGEKNPVRTHEML